MEVEVTVVPFDGLRARSFPLRHRIVRLEGAVVNDGRVEMTVRTRDVHLREYQVGPFGVPDIAVTAFLLAL